MVLPQVSYRTLDLVTCYGFEQQAKADGLKDPPSKFRICEASLEIIEGTYGSVRKAICFEEDGCFTVFEASLKRLMPGSADKYTGTELSLKMFVYVVGIRIFQQKTALLKVFRRFKLWQRLEGGFGLRYVAKRYRSHYLPILHNGKLD